MHIMPELRPTARPTARAAVIALDAFGAVSAREATILIGYWARRNELTPADIDAVLSHYADRHAVPVPVPAPRPAPDADPTGLTYQREPDDPGPKIVRPYLVDGWSATGREAGR
jgi:hypothetical protein